MVITVVVDEPHSKGVGYGGVVAAPSFRKIAEEVVGYLGIKPEETADTSRSSRFRTTLTMNNAQ